MVFELNNYAAIDGTSLKGYVIASYAELKRLFGDAPECDGYKISGQWVFENNDGNVFTLYDWKETELYDDELPSVKKFRNSDEPTEFHVGGKTSAIDFINWIDYKLSKLRLDDAVMNEFNDHARAGVGS